jgi:hypothetical protein
MIEKITLDILENIKNEINNEYGFFNNIPRINYGPCGIFSKIFFDNWNQFFENKVRICFVMTKARDECDHIVIRFPSGELYDGGLGIHTDSEYLLNNFVIDDMFEYHGDILEKWSYGLNRNYPRYCPNFNKVKVEEIIRKNLNSLYKLKS